MSSAVYKVFLFEDSPSDEELIRRYFALSSGPRFTIDSASSIKSGLERIGEKSFDLVLLDLKLHDSTEETTFMTVHKALPRLPIVVMTGGGDQWEGSRWVREGAQDFLVKGDFDGRLLCKTAIYAIERARLQKELEVARAEASRLQELNRLDQVFKRLS